MSSYRGWRESGHLERAIETAGGPERFEAEVRHLGDENRIRRLTEITETRIEGRLNHQYYENCLPGYYWHSREAIGDDPSRALRAGNQSHPTA
ncbi:hypothetical protein [Streptosporangium sp. NBC_01469]|uniref:hypothetical protein n=1 Tax=Streptosporangium sp. NBC_01469 TaxID=2903898 RepID=UPI002E2DD219|nr:hypothetical protein [Streptosporangium sp. NBC_01469]